MKRRNTANLSVSIRGACGRRVFAGAWILAVCLAGCSRDSGSKAKREDEGVPVRAAGVVQEDVPIEVQAIGNGEPVATVTMRPQVDGQVVDIRFIEGQLVQPGDPLYILDQRPFEAALRLAEANLAKDEAMLRDSESEVRRMNSLRDQKVAADREMEQAQATADSRAAQVLGDKASIDMAKLRLEYCTIRAPFTGRTGARLVDRGKSVKANDTDLVVINQISPIYVKFSVAEKHLSKIRDRMAAGPLEVRAMLSGETGPPEVGTLAFIDNQVDTTTGMIRLRASFANEHGRIWPGRFVTVSLVVERMPNAIVVPSQAVQVGQNGTYVYVVKPDLTVEPRPVKAEGTLAARTIVLGDVKAGETVVTDGQLRLIPGAKVRILKEADKPAAKST